MNLELIRIVEVNTTAFKEENFVLLTDLTDEQISDVIKPIVQKERNETDEDEEEFYYDNEELFSAIKEIYPNNIIQYYSDNNFDVISV